MFRGTAHQAIPGDLGIIMGMGVNETRAEHESISIYLLLGLCRCKLTNFNNGIARNSHIADKFRITQSIHNSGISNY